MHAPLPDTDQQIHSFLSGSPHAVVGASRNRAKFGNKVLRTYIQNNRPVFAINPNEDTVEGLKSYPALHALPQPVHGVSIITPPRITEQVIAQAASLGIKHLWLQPGAESPAAINLARSLNLNIIAQGPCILVVLGFPD